LLSTTPEFWDSIYGHRWDMKEQKSGGTGASKKGSEEKKWSIPRAVIVKEGLGVLRGTAAGLLKVLGATFFSRIHRGSDKNLLKGGKCGRPRT